MGEIPAPPKPTPLQERTTKEFMAVTIGGMMFAFNGGMLQATTSVDDRHMSTGPMTGATTNVGMGLGGGNFVSFGMAGGLIISHFIGAAMSGYLVPNRTFYLGSPYGRIIKLGCLILTAAALIDFFVPESLFYYNLVALTTGLQNAMTSRYSGNILRTTHVTGSLTDIGLIAGRLWHGQQQNMWKLKVNLCLVASFFAGCVVATFSFKDLKSSQLFVNVGLFLFIGLLYSVFIKPEKEYRPFLRMLGLYEKKADPPLDEGAAPDDEEGLRDDPPADPVRPDLGVYGAVKRSKSTDGLELTVLEEANLDTSHVPADSQIDKVAASSSIAVAEPVATKQPTVLDGWSFRRMMIGVVFLCMNCGFINATTGLSSQALKTSHMTGNTTAFAIKLVNEDFDGASVRIVMIFCYVLGAAICGSLVSSDFYSLKAPYHKIFALGTVMLSVALLVHIYFPDSFYFYYITATFCGMQSAVGCKVKGTVVRTAYMSGCVADLGAACGKMLRFGWSSGQRTVQLLLPTLLAYAFGACMATLLFPILGKYQILVNIIGFSCLGIVYKFIQTESG